MTDRCIQRHTHGELCGVVRQREEHHPRGTGCVCGGERTGATTAWEAGKLTVAVPVAVPQRRGADIVVDRDEESPMCASTNPDA